MLVARFFQYRFPQSENDSHCIAMHVLRMSCRAGLGNKHSLALHKLTDHEMIIASQLVVPDEINVSLPIIYSIKRITLPKQTLLSNLLVYCCFQTKFPSSNNLSKVWWWLTYVYWTVIELFPESEGCMPSVSN